MKSTSTDGFGMGLSTIFQIRKFQADPQLSPPSQSFSTKAKADPTGLCEVVFPMQRNISDAIHERRGPLLIDWFGFGICILTLSSKLGQFVFWANVHWSSRLSFPLKLEIGIQFR